MHRQVMRIRTPPDQADDLVQLGVDDVVDGSRVVALQDPHGHTVVGLKLGHRLRRRGRGDKQSADDRECSTGE